jgi:hypothetical protein
MNNDELESLIRDSAIPDSHLPENREMLRNVLVNLHNHRQKRFSLRLWIMPAILLGCFCVTTALYMIVEDNNQSGPVNNLGGVWSTFTDSILGGTSMVWPPVSTSCENLFVKSAPGYGGKGYAVRIKGTTGTGDSAFLGVNTYLSEKASCPRCIGIDLRKYSGISFKMKGDVGKGRLLFILPHESNRSSADNSTCMTLTGYNDYQADITAKVRDEWTTVKLLFRKDFNRPIAVKPSEKVKIESVLEDEKMIKWKWSGEEKQKIDLWIDDVELF